MSKKQVFQAVNEKKQKDYERSARLQYDPVTVNESIKRWGSYDDSQKEAISAEGNRIYSDLADALIAGKAPQSAEVQVILEGWHNHLGHFYEPSLEILRGLGELYNTNPDFIANFKKLHPDLPGYLQAAITQYVDDLEEAELARLLAADQSKANKGDAS